MTFDPKPVLRDGKPVDWLTDLALKAAERRLGYKLTVVQGHRVGAGVAASASTHDRWGVVDLLPWDWENKVHVLRAIGFAAWHRPAIAGLWSEHIHAVLIGHPDLDPMAARQIDSYRAHRDGLKSNAPDPTWHPDPVTVFEPPAARTLNGGVFNVRISRPAADVAADVRGLVEDHDLDFLLLQEVHEHHVDALNALPGLRVAVWDPSGTAVIVRKSETVTSARAIPLGMLPWIFNRKVHRPRGLATCMLDGWLRVGSVHMVPAPFTSRSRPLAYAENCRKLITIGKRARRSLLLAGDWNKSAVVTGPNTPRDVADAIGATITKAGRIDFPMTRDCTVSNVTVLPESATGSDHAPVLFTITEGAPS